MEKQKIKLTYIWSPTLAVPMVKNSIRVIIRVETITVQMKVTRTLSFQTMKVIAQTYLWRAFTKDPITQFSRKHKLPRKAQNDLLTLLKLHCPEGVEIALFQTYKQLLKKTLPSLANVAKIQVCSICAKKIEGDATECEDGHPAGRPNKEDSYFFELHLEPQLKMVIEGTVAF